MQPLSRERALLIGVSAITFSIVTLIRKVAVSRISPLQYEAMAGTIHLMMVPVLLAIMCKASATFVWDKVGLLWVLAATLLNVVGTITFLYALRSGQDTGVVSTMAGASPVITVMLAAILLGEYPGMKQMIGIALVLAGVVVASGR